MAGVRGRPISFDKEVTLDRVLGLFWERGYIATSYADLCAETGLAKPSLYAAYGNKAETFLAALNLYVSRYIQPKLGLIEREPDPQKAVHKTLIQTVKDITTVGRPQGCMIATNAACIDAPNVSQALADAIVTAAEEVPKALTANMNQAQAVGRLPASANIDALAMFYTALIVGLSGLAKLGTPRAELMLAVDTAMLAWPSNAPS